MKIDASTKSCRIGTSGSMAKEFKTTPFTADVVDP